MPQVKGAKHYQVTFFWGWKLFLLNSVCGKTNYREALSDAKRAVYLKPEWEKVSLYSIHFNLKKIYSVLNCG